MENRSAFLWNPRFKTTALAVTGLLGIFLLLPGRLANPGLPIYKHKRNHVDTTVVFAAPPQLQGKIVKQVRLGAGQKAIALTFDDGPMPKTTEQVLTILKQNNIKATFFWIGINLKKYPDIGRKVVAEGHAIGNHTWHHWYFPMSPTTAAAEIENTSKLIYDTTGVKTLLFRPPGGFLNNGLARYAISQNYTVTMWSVEPGEFKRRNTAASYVKNVISHAAPGGIVLLHDIHPRTVLALPQIIAGLKQRGYQFVTVPELLKMQSTVPKLNSKTQK